MINNPAHAALPLSFFYIEQFYRLLLQKLDLIHVEYSGSTQSLRKLLRSYFSESIVIYYSTDLKIFHLSG